MDNTSETQELQQVENLKQQRRNTLRVGFITVAGLMFSSGVVTLPAVYTKFFNPSFLKNADEMLREVGIRMQMGNVLLILSATAFIASTIVAGVALRKIREIDKNLKG